MDERDMDRSIQNTKEKKEIQESMILLIPSIAFKSQGSGDSESCKVISVLSIINASDAWRKRN